MTEENYIFRFEKDSGWLYKGVLTAQIDKKAVYEEVNDKEMPLKDISTYQVEVLGMIWTDEVGEWNMKMRMKFPSGNKQAFSKKYGKDSNETFILQDMYKMPMINKRWYKNPTGDLDKLIEIMLKNDLVESIVKVKGENILN